MPPDITLLEGVPPSLYPKVWAWLHEFPENNFDDSSVRSYEEFAASMEDRAHTERIWLVSAAGEPCGIIAYLPLDARLGCFHGICFARAVHGQRIAKHAVRHVLDLIFASGTEKIQAAFFATTPRINRFLLGLGAVTEGLLRKQATRHGVPVDMQLLAFFKD